jgi:hypothetical protein
MTRLVTRVVLIDKVYNDSYETHDKITSPPTNTHDDAADNTKENANLGNRVAAIGWHFIVVI